MTTPIPSAPDSVGAPKTAGLAAGRGSASMGWTRALQRTASIDENQTALLVDLVDAFAAQDGEAPALVAENGVMRYGALSERANRYACWAVDQGLRPGDTVALLLGNCPDYLAIWLGLSKVGVVSALLNTQLTGASLAHCLALARASIVIVGHAFAPILRVPEGTQGWVHGGPATGLVRIDEAIAAYDLAALAQLRRPHVTLSDRALLIYTSGTTGLPKAANVSHYRIMMWSQWFAGIMDARREDRLYNCLPMYHSVGGVVATGAMLAAGGSIVIRERFSATRFWDDVAATDCTVFQYIGELCRYLLNQPEAPAAPRHKLRLCCGNGLRADVWERFQARFAIPQILEFYASTEGSFSLFNLEGQPGAIGRIPGFMAHRSPVALVRFDMDSAMPVRGDDGFCIRCAPGEAGEAIGRVAAESKAVSAGLSTRFEGYTEHAESEKKILRDVFKPGDAWFRTGDLMRKDAKGFFSFVDRIGDTYRWKGENVAVSEVEIALCGCPGVVEANVYGVSMPGADGRAGMAALVVEAGFDLAVLRASIKAALPAFARPLFLRLRADMDVTGTFKQKKQTLVAEGYDPTATTDPLYFDDAARGCFTPVDGALYAAIQAMRIKL